MFSNVAFDVVIGLVFIYLLYSLFATVLAEIIATQIGLRAYNLKEAVDRMLNDEDDEAKTKLERVIDSFKIMKNPDNPMVRNFYNHPEIKYLGSTGVFKTPSSFKSASFSKTILYSLSGEGAADKLKITDKLNRLMTGEVSLDEKIFDKETAKYVKSLWDDSYGDIVKFKLRLEVWFDRTMEQCLEWYKRKIQFILMVIGFGIAWFFNADTFTIIHTLSKDDKAREQLVSMANAYVENNKGALKPENVTGVTDSTLKEYNAKLDSLLKVKKELEKDISKANSILGLGGWLPDTLKLSINSITGERTYTPRIDYNSLPEEIQRQQVDKIYISQGDKWMYFLGLFGNHFFGFLITAIAISLGAPFWFDMLNKLMKLRTAVKQDTDKAGLSVTSGISPLNREA